MVRACVRVQRVVRGHLGRKRARFVRLMKEVVDRAKFLGAQAMQRVYRYVGHR